MNNFLKHAITIRDVLVVGLCFMAMAIVVLLVVVLATNIGWVK